MDEGARPRTRPPPQRLPQKVSFPARQTVGPERREDLAGDRGAHLLLDDPEAEVGQPGQPETLRHGCDPMGSGLLSSWRESSDEQMMQAMLGLL